MIGRAAVLAIWALSMGGLILWGFHEKRKGR
ncbi:MAG: hypothetical protein JWQ87_5489 [Candidatus Sulfotelmatobacter sp.]|nr:hypothetical protein [Candidatus Sulfotelmatobacter sp.]